MYQYFKPYLARVAQKITCLVLLAVSLGIAPLHAEPYFDASAISPALLNPPPSPQDDIWKQEIEGIIALQAQVGEEEVQKALSERDMSPELMTLAIDPEITRERYPALYALLDRASDTTRAVGGNAKDYWHTLRPYMADDRVRILVKAHTNNAYPSGHTLGAYVWGYILSLVMPDKRDALMERAEEIAQHRVLVGMHFPHDLNGGRELALISMGALSVNKAFQDDLAKARLEWNAAHAQKQ